MKYPVMNYKQIEKIRKKYAKDWEVREQKYLYKKVAFDDYNAALRFMMMIEKPQIKLDHFADLGLFYNEMIIMVYTHDVKALTQLDFELAVYIDYALDKISARQL
jgi:pterin-4a-carbinolamine dehydratase